MSPFPLSIRSCRLLPLGIDANRAAHRAREANKAVVQRDPRQRCRRHRQIAEIRRQLQLARRALPIPTSSAFKHRTNWTG